MTEPVIDIRDRIEKMRNQMTSPEGLFKSRILHQKILQKKLMMTVLRKKIKIKVNC